MEFPLGIQRIAKGSTATVAAAFQDVLSLSTHDLLGKVGGVVFRITFQHRFQNDAFRPLGDDLSGRHELDAILLQLGLVQGTVVAVPSKTVQLPDQHNVKQLLVLFHRSHNDLRKHILRLLPANCAGRRYFYYLHLAFLLVLLFS